MERRKKAFYWESGINMETLEKIRKKKLVLITI